MAYIYCITGFLTSKAPKALRKIPCLNATVLNHRDTEAQMRQHAGLAIPVYLCVSVPLWFITISF
jgi:hypothetical protein